VGKICTSDRAANIASANPALVQSLHRQRSERVKTKTWVPYALTAEGATYHFSISESTLKRWVAEGIMPPPITIGGVSLYLTDECEAALLRQPRRGEKPKADEALSISERIKPLR
jgi:hypothetical protein